MSKPQRHQHLGEPGSVRALFCIILGLFAAVFPRSVLAQSFVAGTCAQLTSIPDIKPSTASCNVYFEAKWSAQAWVACYDRQMAKFNEAVKIASLACKAKEQLSPTSADGLDPVDFANNQARSTAVSMLRGDLTAYGLGNNPASLLSAANRVWDVERTLNNIETAALGSLNGSFASISLTDTFASHSSVSSMPPGIRVDGQWAGFGQPPSAAKIAVEQQQVADQLSRARGVATEQAAANANSLQTGAPNNTVRNVATPFTGLQTNRPSRPSSYSAPTYSPPRSDTAGRNCMALTSEAARRYYMGATALGVMQLRRKLGR